MIVPVFDRVENIVGRREIASTSDFSFSHRVLKRLLSQSRHKVSLCGNGLTLKAPFTTIVALVASVDQDQAARNVQPDL